MENEIPTIKTPGGERPLTDLERCLLLILKKADNISSDKVLKIAKKFKICAACSDRSEVFYIGERLSRKKIVTKELIDSQYIWSLTEKGRKLSRKI